MVKAYQAAGAARRRTRRAQTALQSPAQQQAEERRYDPLEGAGEELTRETVEKNKLLGQKTLLELEQAGVTGGREYERAAKMAEQGFEPQEPWILRNLEKLDIPLRLIKATVADWTQLDQKAGTEIDLMGTYRDIVQQNNASLRRRLGEDLVGERADFSTDKLFNLAGWEQPDNWWAQRLRGAAHFATDVAGDPLSYITFGASGVAKRVMRETVEKIAQESSERALDVVARGVAREARDSIDDAFETALRGKASKLDEVMEQIVKQEGEGVTAEAAREAAWRQLAEEARDETLEPVARAYGTRDFKAVPEWFRNAARIQEEAPFLRGGARLTANPLGVGIRGGAGAPIPGTVGLGRKINRFLLGTRSGTVKPGGTKLAGFLDRAGVLNKLEDFAGAFSNYSPVVSAWKEGTIVGIRTSRILADGVNGAQTALGLRDLQHTLSHQARQMVDATKGLDDDALAKVNREFLEAVQSGVLDSQEGVDAFRRALPSQLDDEAREAVVSYAAEFRGGLETLFQRARQMGIPMRRQADYVPLVWSDKFQPFLTRLANQGVGIPVGEAAPEEIREGLAWLAEAVAARQRRAGSAGGQSIIGETKFANERVLGRQVAVNEMPSGLLISGLEGVDLKYATHADMNDQITKAARWLAEQNRISTGFDNALEVDPLSVMRKYMGSMSAAVQERYLVRQLKSVGAIRPATFRTDVGRLLADVTSALQSPKAQRALQTRVEKIANTMAGLEGQLADPLAETKKVRILGRDVELPKRAVDEMTPRLRRRIEDANTRQKAWDRSSTTLERRRQTLAQRLVANGVEAEEAASIASMDSIRDMRAAIRTAAADLYADVRKAADDLAEVADRVLEDSAAAVKAREAAQREANRMLKNADRVTSQARRQLHREVSKGLRSLRQDTLRTITYDSEPARRRLAVNLAPVLTERLEDALGVADLGEVGTEAVNTLKGLLDNFMEDLDLEAMGDGMRNLLRQLRESVSDIEPTEAKLDSMRGLALEALGAIRRGTDEIGDRAWRQIEQAPTQGEGSVFELLGEWASRLDYMIQDLGRVGVKNMTDGQKAYLSKLGRIRSQVDEARAALEASVTRAEPDWQLREWLQGVELFEQVEVLRKIAQGQNVMRSKPLADATRSLLEEVGLVGENFRLVRRKGGLGFELQEEGMPWATLTEALDEIKREAGIINAEEAARLAVISRFESFEAYEEFLQGRIQDSVQLDTLRSFVDNSFRADNTRLTDDLGNGIRREVNERGEVLWSFVNDAGERSAWIHYDPNIGDGWINVGRLPSTDDVVVEGERVMDALTRAARARGDRTTIGTQVTEAGARRAYRKAQEAMANISPEARRTLEALEEMPEQARQVSVLEQAIEEAYRVSGVRGAAEETGSKALAAARSAAKARKTIDRLRDEVLTPLRNKTSRVVDLESADTALRAIRRDLEKVLKPSEVSHLDVLADEVGRRRALLNMADNVDDDARRVIDAMNDYRRRAFDPDVTAESIRELADDVSRAATREDIDKQAEAIQLLNDMTTTFQRLLGLGTDADGRLAATFVDEGVQEELSALVEAGKKLWRRSNLGDDINPFTSSVVPTQEIPGFVPPSAYNLGGDVWGSVIGDRYALRWMQNVTAQMVASASPEGLTEFSRKARKVLNWWKAQATVVRPTFHIRNFIGGMWNGQYADVRLKDYGFAIKHTSPFLKALKDNATVDAALDTLPEAARPYYRAAWDAGVFDDTFASSEILVREMQRRGRSRYNPLSTQGPLVTGGGEVMSNLEGNMRMAVFARHFNPDAENLAGAARLAKGWVDLVHFNYSDLTQMEEWTRRFVPFFVWFRRNLPLQMQTIIERPMFLQRYQHLINAIDSQDSTPYDDLPPNLYRQKRLYATIGAVNEDTPFWSQVIIDPDLPIAGVFELDEPLHPTSWIQLLTNQLGPQFDMLRTFSAPEEEGYWVNAPGGLTQILNTVPLPGVDSTEQGVARMKPWAAKLYNTAFPPLRELGGFALEKDPRRRQALGQTPIPEGEDSILDDVKAGLWTLARGAGVQLQGVDDSYSTAIGSSFSFNDLRRELRKRGILTPEIEKAAEAAASREEARAKLGTLLGEVDS